MDFIRGMIIPIEGGIAAIRFQWNPRELRGFTAHADYAELKVIGRDTPFLQFSSGQVKQLDIELEFSKGSNGDGYVMGMVNSVQELTKPLVKGATLHRPPRVMWIFGEMPKKLCVITRADSHFSVPFSATLDPQQARVSLTLLEHKG